jgi:serine/threonine protein kinase
MSFKPLERTPLVGNQRIASAQVTPDKERKLLGAGGYGIVKKGTFLPDGTTMAIKSTLSSDIKHQQALNNESEVLKWLKEKNLSYIPKYIGEQRDESNDLNTKELYMEFVEGVTLEAAANAGLEDDVKKQAVKDLLTILKELHALDVSISSSPSSSGGPKTGVVHRDLHLGNVMFDGRKVTKLIDFGKAKIGAIPEDKNDDMGFFAMLTEKLIPGYQADEALHTVLKRCGNALSQKITASDALKGLASW